MIALKRRRWPDDTGPHQAQLVLLAAGVFVPPDDAEEAPVLFEVVLLEAEPFDVELVEVELLDVESFEVESFEVESLDEPDPLLAAGLPAVLPESESVRESVR